MYNYLISLIKNCDHFCIRRFKYYALKGELRK